MWTTNPGIGSDNGSALTVNKRIKIKDTSKARNNTLLLEIKSLIYEKNPVKVKYKELCTGKLTKHEV